MYYTYIIRCEDNSLYTGITTDLKRRMDEHFSKSDKCAKYTFRHSAKSFEIAWESSTRVLASKLEYRIKHLNKLQKENLIKNHNHLDSFFKDTIDHTEYKKIDFTYKFNRK